MRIYHKISQLLSNPTKFYQGSFITFKPKRDNVKPSFFLNNIEDRCQKSPIMSKLIEDNRNNLKTGYGIGSSQSKYKIWISPLGDQLDFMQNLANYKPFIDINQYTDIRQQYDQGLLHYVGYFPQYNYHQFYFYLGKDIKKADCVDTRLRYLDADYFAYSLTLDDSWNLIKFGSYAVKVPFDNCKHLVDNRLIEADEITSKHLNLSYRKWIGKAEDEFVISYLVLDTLKPNSVKNEPC